MNLNFAVQDEAYKAVRGFSTKQETEKLFRERRIWLVSARNQSAAFQLLLASDEEFLLAIDGQTCFDKCGLTGQVRLCAEIDGGALLACSIGIVGFVRDDDGLMKADILLKDRSAPVGKNEIQPVWVELKVPGQCPAEVYCGKIAFYYHKGFEAEQKLGEVSFELAVKDVTLPDSRDYGFYLDLWQHNSNIARKHETPMWSDEHFAVLEQYVASLAALGQKAVTAVVSEIPWSGQFCYRDTDSPSDLYEYSMVRVCKNREGALETDFSVLDRYIDLCFRYGIDSEIEVFGLLNVWMCEDEGFGRVVEELSDGIRVRFFDEHSGCYGYMDAVDDLTRYIQGLEEHFAERGLIDRVRVVADEPAELGVFAERMAFLKKVAPRFQYKAAVDHAEFIGAFSAEISDFIPDFNALSRAFSAIKPLQEEISGKLSWYVCCGPDLPNTFIRSHLRESCAVGPLTEYLGLDGFLRWGYTAWPEHPRERISYRAHVWPAGDTCFVYPSASGGPLLTLRYKALLKGIQIFELMRMLKDGNPDARAILARVFSEIGDFDPAKRQKAGELISLDPEDWRAAHELLLDGIADSLPVPPEALNGL